SSATDVTSSRMQCAQRRLQWRVSAKPTLIADIDLEDGAAAADVAGALDGVSGDQGELRELGQRLQHRRVPGAPRLAARISGGVALRAVPFGGLIHLTSVRARGASRVNREAAHRARIM